MRTPQALDSASVTTWWQTVVGGLIAIPSAATWAVPKLAGMEPDSKPAALVLAAIRELVGEGSAPTAGRVVQRLEQGGDLEVIGGIEFLIECVIAFRDVRAISLARLRRRR